MVSVVVDLGGIPKVTPTNKEKAMRIFTEWQTARKVTENRVSAYFKIAENKNAIGSIDEFNRCQIQRQNFYLMSIDQASRLKTKHSRLAALEKINAKISILGQKSR